MIISNDILFAEVERLLDEGAEVKITVRGGSMRPLLRDGRDSVVMRRHRKEEIVLGQVMLFRYRGRHVMHRVVALDGEQVMFAGDGNYRVLEQASVDDIVATVVAVERDGRRIECSSRWWRVRSRAWLTLPPIVRRVVLGVMRRLKF